MIQQVLSQYTQVIPQADGYAINCPWCAGENHKKMIYFYKSGVTICFRCKGIKDRKWSNSWKCLNDVLKKLGVDNRKLLSYNGSLNFIGNGISTQIKRYDNHEFTNIDNSSLALNFINNRGLDSRKIKEYLYFGIKGPMKDKVCWPLFPSGFQCRSLEKKEYRIYNEKHNNAIFCTDPISKINELFIVEGALDSLMLYQYGYSSLATIGTNPSPVIKQVLANKQPESLYLWFDPDEAGAQANVKFSKYLVSGNYDIYIINYHKEAGDCISSDEVSEAISEARPISYEEIYR